MSPPCEPMPPERCAEFRDRARELGATIDAAARPPVPLGPGELRAMLRECVNVVEPGDVLVIRLPPQYEAHQVNELGRYVTMWLADHAPGVHALVVPAEEITVFRPAPFVTFGEQPAGPLPPEVVEDVRRRLAEVRADRPGRINLDPDTQR